MKSTLNYVNCQLTHVYVHIFIIYVCFINYLSYTLLRVSSPTTYFIVQACNRHSHLKIRVEGFTHVTESMRDSNHYK